MSDSKIADEIRRLETHRREVLVGEDYAGLDAMLAENLQHIHANGTVEDKPAYLAAMKAKFKFLEIERPALDVRVFGDVAVSIGPLNQKLVLRENGAEAEMKATATQVWVKNGDSWLLASFQATRIG